MKPPERRPAPREPEIVEPAKRMPFRAADTTESLPDVGTEQPPAADPRPWQTDFADVPRDGAIVVLLFGNHTKTATWRTTRRRNIPPLRGWGIVSFWADPVSREEISGKPDAWRRPEGVAALNVGLMRGKA